MLASGGGLGIVGGPGIVGSDADRRYGPALTIPSVSFSADVVSDRRDGGSWRDSSLTAAALRSRKSSS
ncbi:hypothetical protein O4214_02010 [Rhodococcus erythropolis]|uniref:hypothetical protein n=1 Tax=Rhodococcus erythropolis TaxID=1833 RepID=UPI001E43C5D6|nr:MULTISPECIES: hypothetical protein [Rhodococcus erythropolis group]MCD2103692.1 hypothetical protein [Rhodococcus qingshengii]MCZ4522742.1 hypothetical protein [Rhodococcus erythropolis]